MTQIQANGITLEYEDYPSSAASNGETVLLIMGLGAQLTAWPPALVAALNARGYRVIRYDNRDVGLSQKFGESGPADMGAIMAALASGTKPNAAYLLDDMAADAAGLLKALGIARAHIVGASMGGMIAQQVAANHPQVTLSLTSIMSTTGNPALPPARPEAMAVLLNRPASTAMEDIVAAGVAAQQTIGSKVHPVDEAELRARVTASYHRSHYPEGFGRQMAAIMASGDRREALKRITAPTMVVHGADDPLVLVDGGLDTAATIGGAELRILPGMAHDLPEPLIPAVVEAIEAAAARARAPAK